MMKHFLLAVIGLIGCAASANAQTFPTRPVSIIVTSAACGCVPSGTVASELVAHALGSDPGLPLAAGGGALAKEMIRVNHYGPDATRDRRSTRF